MATLAAASPAAAVPILSSVLAGSTGPAAAGDLAAGCVGPALGDAPLAWLSSTGLRRSNARVSSRVRLRRKIGSPMRARPRAAIVRLRLIRVPPPSPAKL